MFSFLRRLSLPAGAFLFAAALLFVGGCDSFLDVNEDPYEPTNASPSGLLAGAIFHTAEANYDAASVTSYYVQHLASPSGSDLDRHYEVHLDDAWERIYSDALADLDSLKRIAGEDAPHYTGAANVLFAYNLGLATDLWGAIPSSDALKGADNLTPTYDEQEVVYDRILTLLDDAIAQLQAEESAFEMGASDFIYEGDISKWLKFAYALKARYLNHLSETDRYDPQAVLAATENAFADNDDDAQVPYSTDDDNPWHDVVENNEGGILGGFLSEQFVGAMNGRIYGEFDPRLPQIVDSLEAGPTFSPPPYFIGTRNGEGAPNTAYNFLVGKSIYDQASAPIYLSTYAEIKFIEAEAALRAGQPDRAYDAYLQGIRAHMRKLEVPQDAQERYIQSPGVGVGADALTLDDIFREKWKALFLNPEAWVDVRRHDYDYQDMQPPFLQNPELQSAYIRRILYPDTELERNRSNVPDVSLGEPLWWDQ